jgi:hypothetical protein
MERFDLLQIPSDQAAPRGRKETSVRSNTEDRPPAKVEVSRNWPTTETSLSEDQSERSARTGLSEIETRSGRGERKPVLHDPAFVEPI